MPSFPASAATPPPIAPRRARYIGSVALNDGVNAWCDPPMLPFTRLTKYELQAQSETGVVSRTRWARKGAVIVVNGEWHDGGGRQWEDFLLALEGCEGVPLIIGDGTKFASCDVVDCTATLQTATERDAVTGAPVRWLKWSMKVQALTALRVPV